MDADSADFLMEAERALRLAQEAVAAQEDIVRQRRAAHNLEPTEAANPHSSNAAVVVDEEERGAVEDGPQAALLADAEAALRIAQEAMAAQELLLEQRRQAAAAEAEGGTSLPATQSAAVLQDVKISSSSPQPTTVEQTSSSVSARAPVVRVASRAQGGRAHKVEVEHSPPTSAARKAPRSTSAEQATSHTTSVDDDDDDDDDASAVAFHGPMIELSGEDIQRIRDPDVLQFLEEHSELFSKYMRRDGNGDGEEEGVSGRRVADNPPSNLQHDLEELQREIDTFITAVDQHGKSYHIHVDDCGSVHVPMMEQAGDGWMEEDDDESIVMAPPPPRALVEEVEVPVATAEPEEEEEENPSHVASEINNTKKDDDDVAREPKKVSGRRYRMPPSSPAMNATHPPSGQRRKAAIKSLRPHPRTGLSGGAQRVSTILRSGFVDECKQNPFQLSASQLERCAEVDAALVKFGAARGMLWPPSSSLLTQEVLEEDAHEDGGTPDVMGGPHAAQHQKELGNRYLKEAQAARKREAIERRVQAQLSKHKQDGDQLALLGAMYAEGATPSPAMLDGLKLVPETSIPEMLERAREEEMRAVAEGIPSQHKPREETTAFMRNLVDARSRAMALMEEAERHPLTHAEHKEEVEVAAEVESEEPATAAAE